MPNAVTQSAATELAPLPTVTRLTGGVTIEAVASARATRLARLAEAGGYRARVTDRSRCQIHVVNPTGGVAGGDVVALRAVARERATLTVTTPAPERFYRSAGETARIDCSLTAERGARLEWIPQPSIVYDGARVRRRVDVECAADARVLVVESLIFGRHADRFEFGDVELHDRWRVRRDGRLVFAEEFRVRGDGAGQLGRRATAAGARVTALGLWLAPDAAAKLETVRAILEQNADCGASVVDGVLVVRWLAPDAPALESAVHRFATLMRDTSPPRGWPQYVDSGSSHAADTP